MRSGDTMYRGFSAKGASECNGWAWGWVSGQALHLEARETAACWQMCLVTRDFRIMAAPQDPFTLDADGAIFFGLIQRDRRGSDHRKAPSFIGMSQPKGVFYAGEELHGRGWDRAQLSWRNSRRRTGEAEDCCATARRNGRHPELDCPSPTHGRARLPWQLSPNPQARLTCECAPLTPLLLIASPIRSAGHRFGRLMLPGRQIRAKAGPGVSQQPVLRGQQPSAHGVELPVIARGAHIAVAAALDQLRLVAAADPVSGEAALARRLAPIPREPVSSTARPASAIV